MSVLILTLGFFFFCCGSWSPAGDSSQSNIFFFLGEEGKMEDGAMSVSMSVFLGCFFFFGGGGEAVGNI